MPQHSSDKPDILIVTVTEIESNAVIDAFGKDTGESYREKVFKELFYFDLGEIGGSRVWMVRSGMGTEGPNGSMLTIQKAIDEVSPKTIIMVGIAFGIKQDEHKIGDVLISKQIVSYEMQKVGATSIKARGDRMPATAHLLQKFESIAPEWSKSESGVPVHCGLILSGNKLIDNLEFRDRLLVPEPEAIGGEMEGAGLSTVAYNNHVDWILVKAICDWADGKKGEDKQIRQTLAARNAAQFTLYVLKKRAIIPQAKTSPGVSNDNAEIVQDFDQLFLQKSIEQIYQGLKRTNYKFAAETGLKASQRIGSQLENDDPEIELLLGEFRVAYSLALIYSGGISEGPDGSSFWLNRVINRLEKRKSFYLMQENIAQRFHLLLGRAYNHLGYSYWMDRGHYEAALSKLNKALEHFIAGKWKQETATAYDNLARVYAQLGFRSHAEFLCNHGLKLREENIFNKDNKENQYRLALSLNSNAIIHLTYGQSLRAYFESEAALEIFEQCVREKGQRGIGLALITKAHAARIIGSHWRFTNDTTFSEGYLQKALDDLKRAEEIFIEVDEDIRLIQVYNELGCIYREYCALHNKAGREEEARQTERKAREFFGKILSNVENAKKYPPAFVDTYHDLAQTVYIVSESIGSDIKNLGMQLNKNLDKAEKIIPEYYQFLEASGRFTRPVEECFEDYWQDLGKIYALRGDLAFRGVSTLDDLDEDVQPIKRIKIKKAFESYILAAGYFGRYTERPISPENKFYPNEVQRLESHFHFARNLYDHLSMLSNQDIKFLRNDVYQQVVDKYKLNPLWVDRFFKQPFDLLCRTSELSG